MGAPRQARTSPRCRVAACVAVAAATCAALGVALAAARPGGGARPNHCTLPRMYVGWGAIPLLTAYAKDFDSPVFPWIATDALWQRGGHNVCNERHVKRKTGEAAA